MTKEEAIQVLLQVAELAQARGIFKLEESATVYQAVSVLTKKEEEVTENTQDGE